MKNYCSVDIHLNKFPSDSYVCQPAPMLSQATVSSLVPEDENKEEEGLSSPDKIDGSEVADDVDMEDVVSEEKVPSSGGDEEVDAPVPSEAVDDGVVEDPVHSPAGGDSDNGAEVAKGTGANGAVANGTAPHDVEGDDDGGEHEDVEVGEEPESKAEVDLDHGERGVKEEVMDCEKQEAGAEGEAEAFADI